MSENKVQFGLKNVHAAVVTETVSGGTTTYSYATPKKIPGAVNLSLSIQGGLEKFYADDIKYYVTYSHQGYEGDLEIAKIPEWFYTDIFQDVDDTKHVLIEGSTLQPKKFALLFEIDGDQKATRNVLYYCSVSRPAIESSTVEESATPQTSKLTISASPRENGSVGARTTATTDSTTYNGWYGTVYEKTS